jgi:hypothetical protein
MALIFELEKIISTGAKWFGPAALIGEEMEHCMVKKEQDRMIRWYRKSADFG